MLKFAFRVLRLWQIWEEGMLCKKEDATGILFFIQSQSSTYMSRYKIPLKTLFSKFVPIKNGANILSSNSVLI